MTKNSRERSLAIRALLGWSVILAITLARPAHAQAPVSYAVTYIEFRESSMSASRNVLRAYAANSRKENGNLLFEALQETGRKSRFAILEAWNSRDALDKHYHNKNTSRILNQFVTMRTAPDDRRIYEGLVTGARGNRSSSDSVFVMT